MCKVPEKVENKKNKVVSNNSNFEPNTVLEQDIFFVEVNKIENKIRIPNRVVVLTPTQVQEILILKVQGKTKKLKS